MVKLDEGGVHQRKSFQMVLVIFNLQIHASEFTPQVVNAIDIFANEGYAGPPGRAEQRQPHGLTIFGLNVTTPVWFFILVFVPLLIIGLAVLDRNIVSGLPESQRLPPGLLYLGRLCLVRSGLCRM